MSQETLRDKIYAMTLEEADFSVRTIHCLHRANINTIGDIVNCTDDDLLRVKSLGRKSVEEVLQKLYSLGLTLKPSCSYCGHHLFEEDTAVGDGLCSVCRVGLVRTHNAKDIIVSVFSPEKSSYTGGYEGFHIFVNIQNNTNSPMKLELSECAIYKEGRQRVSDSNLVGYEFSNDYVFPGSTRTFAKIWKTESWVVKDLIRNNYLTIALKDDKTGKLYYFKFTQGYKELYFSDYFEVEAN